MIAVSNIANQRAKIGPRLRRWRWPMTGTYNGFTGPERIRVSIGIEYWL